MLLNKLFYQSPGILSANTLPVRATLFNFAGEADALAAAGTPEHGEYCQSLNGKWHFRYLENPNELTEDDLLADLSACDTIMVPGAVMSLVLRTLMGIPGSLTGNTASSWRTFAPM